MRLRYALCLGSFALAAWMLAGCGETTSSSNRFKVGQAITYDANGQPVTDTPGGYVSDANGNLTRSIHNSRLDFLVIGSQKPVSAGQNTGPSIKAFIQAQFVNALNTNVTFEIADLYYDPTRANPDKIHHVYATGTTAQAVDFRNQTSQARLQADGPDPAGTTFTTPANFPQSFNKTALTALTAPDPNLLAGASPVSQVGNFDLTNYTYTPPSHVFSDPLPANPPLHTGKPLDTFNLWIIPQDPTLTPSFITIHLNLNVAITSSPNPAAVTVNTPEAPTQNAVQFSASVPGDGINPPGSQVTWNAYQVDTKTNLPTTDEYTNPPSKTGPPLINLSTGLFTAPIVTTLLNAATQQATTNIVSIDASGHVTQGDLFPSVLPLSIKATSKIISTIPVVDGAAGNTYYTSVPLSVTKASGTISFH